MTGERILLTGATGFVGSRLWPALQREGCQVRCASRDPARARARWPEREWVAADLRAPEQLRAALQGCAAAFYLVHQMGEDRPGLRRREVATARSFAQAAAEAGVRRIVYLGGVAPVSWERNDGERPSEHLASRLEVGETLRAGPVPAIELRASMIVGHGSESWQIVRDLAARLPAMVLPRWLRSRTQPVAIEDVIIALTRSLSLPPGCYDIPGPEVLAGEEILRRTARVMGLQPPLMIPFPGLSPRLSSLWLRLVTGARWSVAREIVLGLKEDLLAVDASYWQRIGHSRIATFEKAARRALEEEPAGASTGRGLWKRVEALVARVHRAPSDRRTA